MDIQVDCSCGQKFVIDRQYAGQAVACPTCGATVVVPVPVWAPVQVEALPELKVQPAFSSYTLPGARPPSLWSLYKWWIVGSAALLILVALVSSIVVGLIWLMSLLEPRAPGQGRPEPTLETPHEPGAKPGPGPPAARPARAAPTATQDDDTEDFEGDAMPAPSEREVRPTRGLHLERPQIWRQRTKFLPPSQCKAFVVST